MSMSVQVAKRQYMGDPGLFDFLGKVVKTGLGVASALPGIGGAAGAARSLFFPADARASIPGATAYAQNPLGMPIPRQPTGMPGSGSATLGPGEARPGVCDAPRVRDVDGICKFRGDWIDKGGKWMGRVQGTQGFFPKLGEAMFGPKTPGPSVQIPDFGPVSPSDMTEFQVTTKMLAGRPTGWPGYHWNKSDYWLKTGEYVPAGTRAVRNRRMNPCNPRAVSRSIRRVKGAKRFAKSLSHISIRHQHSKH